MFNRNSLGQPSIPTISLVRIVPVTNSARSANPMFTTLSSNPLGDVVKYIYQSTIAEIRVPIPAFFPQPRLRDRDSFA